MRYAALDLGSNSFHLLVADLRPGGHIKRVRTEKRTIRLGEPVSRTGKLGSEARARAGKAFAELLAAAQEESSDAVVAVATESLRAARDGGTFGDEVAAAHGVRIQILTGDEEAALSLRGMVAALGVRGGDRILGVDLGGGSFELAYGGIDGCLASASLPLGTSRLVDRLSDPPQLRQRVALYQEVVATLAPAVDGMREVAGGALPTTVVGTAGTIRDLGRLGLALASGAAPQKVRGVLVSRSQVERAFARLCSLPAAERPDLPGVSAKRADILPVGGLVVLAALDVVGADVLQLCDYGLREGALLDVASEGGIVDVAAAAEL